MKYSIAMQVRGYYIVDVEAENVEEAKTKAENAWAEADFGELSILKVEHIKPPMNRIMSIIIFEMEEDNMTLEDYRQLMIGITKMHIKTAQDELDNGIMFPEERLLKEGYINGLEQAIYTLEHSEFLTNKKGGE